MHSQGHCYRDRKMEEERNWEELNMDCLVKVFERVGMETLILEVPFVCKSWHRASLNPECWKILHFPNLGLLINVPCVWSFNPFVERFIYEYRLKKFSVTGFVKLVVSRSRRSTVDVVLPTNCSPQDLEFVSNECPALKVLGLPSDLFYVHDELIPKLVSKWKDLQQLNLGCSRYLKEIPIQLSLNCKKINGLSVGGYVGNEEAYAIATLLPKIKYLWLRKTSLPLVAGTNQSTGQRKCLSLRAEDDEGDGF